MVVIGAGPGGLTAAIYTARASFKPVVFVGVENVSQMKVTTVVENYAGLISTTGPELVKIQ